MTVRITHTHFRQQCGFLPWRLLATKFKWPPRVSHWNLLYANTWAVDWFSLKNQTTNFASAISCNTILDTVQNHHDFFLVCFRPSMGGSERAHLRYFILACQVEGKSGHDVMLSELQFKWETQLHIKFMDEQWKLESHNFKVLFLQVLAYDTKLLSLA